MRISIIFASTSGHTEYVVSSLVQILRKENPSLEVTSQWAEQAGPEDVSKGDVLILASGTWNTGGSEGQLNPHMNSLLFERLAETDLKEKPIAFVSLGDDRYYFTTRCTEHFQRFRKEKNAKQLLPPLTIVNEPYDQQEKIERWAKKFLTVLPSLVS